MKKVENKLDKYGNPIKRLGQGYGYDPTLKNHQAYDKNGEKEEFWISRACAVSTIVILTNFENAYILANKRGNGAADYQGYWNLPCGYLDFNETLEDAAIREVFEETGVKLDNVEFFKVNSAITNNRQNVSHYYYKVLNGTTEDYPFSLENMEEGEVDKVKWVKIDEIDKLKWAFDHDEIIKDFLNYE